MCPDQHVGAVGAQSQQDVDHAEGKRLRPDRSVPALDELGRKARKNSATFGLSRLTTNASANSRFAGRAVGNATSRPVRAARSERTPSMIR